MKKHTSGPWILDTISGWTDGSKRDLNGDIYIRKEGDALPFGQVFTDTDEREMLDSEIIPERIAAARLIAAAPELLEACKSMLKTCGGSEYWNGETHESLLLIEAAIAKAKGGE